MLDAFHVVRLLCGPQHGSQSGGVGLAFHAISLPHNGDVLDTLLKGIGVLCPRLEEKNGALFPGLSVMSSLMGLLHNAFCAL
jgi:hypothetical protein